MRAKAGDPPRTMAQKVLAGRAEDPSLSGDCTVVKVDQIALCRQPGAVLAQAVSYGLKKAAVEVAVAYDGRVVASSLDGPAVALASDFFAHGVLVGRPGVGFAGAVHLERFASPARLCLTDDPRLASSGGIGMLTVLAPPSQLAEALVTGRVTLRPPRSIQVQLTGRVRPFVCARDVALELIRRGLGEAVQRVEEQFGAPVVLEFVGPSARLLSVAERAVLASLGPELGAWAVVFTSDERTEVYLRDQRRSKAHRVLAPDVGSPCDAVVQIDLSAVDPLLRDEQGKVRSVRDLAGTPVSQALLGGDSGATLRDLLAAAALLKSKRVPPRLDLLLSVPTRQMLEVLASEGALTDLVATGARLIEPDLRVLTGELYPPPDGGASIRTSDPEPSSSGKPFVVASAETLAYAVATGEISDPRGFKRPVRITVPRTLPTDDVLVGREKRSAVVGSKRTLAAGVAAGPWKSAQALAVVGATEAAEATGPCLVVCRSLEDARAATQAALGGARFVRAVVSRWLPSPLAMCLAGVGVAALRCDEAALTLLGGAKSISLPAPAAEFSIAVGAAKVPVVWVSSRLERDWVAAGSARTPSRK